MSILVDTNVLVFAVHAESPHHLVARRFLEGLRSRGGFCVTWSILYEWLRVCTHPGVFARPLDPSTACGFVLTLARDPTIDILLETPGHAACLDEILRDLPAIHGNRYHDVHIAAVMRENGVATVATTDRHFRLFPFLRIVDPTDPARP